MSSILPKKTNLKILFFALAYWAEIFCSFFGRIENTKKTLQNHLTFKGSNIFSQNCLTTILRSLKLNACGWVSSVLAW
jgi:hypothetical protein